MATVKDKDKKFNVEIGLKTSKEWDDNKLSEIKKFAKKEADNRSEERKLKNELLNIKWRNI